MQQRGFSLVEMSVVLAIIGMIAGGIIVGQSMVRSSELRSATTQFQQYRTAISAFTDKYGEMPGDFKSATTYWGKDNTNCSGNTGTSATPGTCNGNNDGYIGDAPGFTNENYRAWQQLGLATMIDGTYLGTDSASGDVANPGSDIPLSKLTNGGWTIVNLDQSSGEFGYTDLGSKSLQLLVLGGKSTTGWAKNGLLKPEEAWSMDLKVDDGIPVSGVVRGGPGNAGSATSCVSATDSTAVYNISTVKSTLCILGFLWQ